MIIELFSAGATPGNDLNNKILDTIPASDLKRLIARFKDVDLVRNVSGVPQMVENAIIFADTDVTTGTWTVGLNLVGANGQDVIATTTTGEITADGIKYLTPEAEFLQTGGTSEQGTIPLYGPGGRSSLLSITEATSGDLASIAIYMMIPDN